jgi:hypothetical protein
MQFDSEDVTRPLDPPYPPGLPLLCIILESGAHEGKVPFQRPIMTLHLRPTRPS